MAIKQRLFIDWNRDGSYTDESSRLVSANGQMRLAAPEDSIMSPRGIMSQMTIELGNGDNRFSVLKTTGALYSDISGGGYYQCPMYFEVSIDSGANYYRMLTGYIKGPVENAITVDDPAIMRFDCRSREELVINKRVSTLQSVFVSLHDNGATESEVIAQWLQDAGLSSTDYTLDPGLFNVEWAWLDDESPIEDAWQIAAACGGRFYCDPDGEFRYENMAHWLGSPHSTSQETLAKNAYNSLRLRYEDGELYKTITVAVGGRRSLESGVIWEANEVYSIPPSTTRQVVAQYQQPAYSITAISHTAQSAGGINLIGDISISTTYYAQRADMLVTNNNATYTALMRNFQIYGRTVHGGPAEEITLNSGASFWTGRTGRTRRLRGNPYIQVKPQADSLVRFLRDRHQLPRLFATVSGTSGRPQRRLGDRITINDPDAMSSALQVFIIGIQWRYNPGANIGFQQDLECMDASIFDDTNPPYYRIGTSQLGTVDASRGKVFY
jgi:hypothetical protein